MIFALQVAVALFQCAGLYWFDTNSGKYASSFATGGSDPPAIANWSALTIWLPLLAQAFLCSAMGMVFTDIRRREGQMVREKAVPAGQGNSPRLLWPWGLAAAGMFVLTCVLALVAVIHYGKWFD